MTILLYKCNIEMWLPGSRISYHRHWWPWTTF